MRTRIRLAPTLLLLGLLACGDDAKRPLGAMCTSHEECQSGVCGGGVCLDPDGDEDLDGLINRMEASLLTNPVEADTDGDGKDDAAEVGTSGSATDSDGDGKIDAVESATADVDKDCIPDELDADDAFAALPSASFPNACGNGRPYPDGGGGGKGLCASVKTFLGGTCAEALGTALAVCFDPVGCITPVTGPGEVSRIAWENGAYIETDSTTEVARMVSSRGTLCAEGEVVSVGETQSVYAYRASGESWTLTVNDGQQTVDVGCASGAVVRISAQASAAISACQAGAGYDLCDGVIPGQCESRADCSDGESCCVISGAGYCMAVETCPSP